MQQSQTTLGDPQPRTRFLTARNDAKPGRAAFRLHGTLVPLLKWRTEVRHRLKPAPQELSMRSEH